MKKILLCTCLYLVLLAMIAVVLLLPGQASKDQAPFFRDFSLSMITFGSLWIVKPLFFTILAPWYTHVWARRKRHFAQYHYQPLVSAIIPAWNEEVGLVATIKTLLASSYRPLEIIVVNDGSTDQSDTIMHTFLQKYQQNVGISPNAPIIRYHYQPNGGKGSALNAGIALSRGEIIMTFDADCIVHKDAIKHFITYFADPDVMAAAGNIKIGNTKTILGFIQTIEYHLGFQSKKAEALLNVVFVIGGAAGAFRREVFERLGGYHTGTKTEDLDLSLRIQEAGMRIVYVPEAVVHTEGPTTFGELLKQRLRWKRGRLEAFSAHKASFFRQQGTNKPFFWIILPLIIIGDLEMILENIYVAALYIYSFLTLDFSFLLITILVVNIIFCIQLWDNQYFKTLFSFLIAPLVWLLLQLILLMEFISLIEAIYTYYLKRDLPWQRWQRTGVADS